MILYWWYWLSILFTSSHATSCLSRIMFLARADLCAGLFLVVSEESLARGTTGGWWNIWEEILSSLLFLVQQLLVFTPTRGVSRCVMTSAMDPVLPIASGLSTRTGGGEIFWYNFVCGQTFSLSNKLLHGANQSLGKTLDCKTVDIATSFLPYKTFFPCFIEFKSLLFLHRWFLWTA